MDTICWEAVKSFYQEKFGIDSWVVELYANLDTILLCASGASNKSISTYLEIELSEIVPIIFDIFKFNGWEKDLPINPLSIYSDTPDQDEFVTVVYLELGKYREFENIEAEFIYNVCKTTMEIESRIVDEWI